MELFQKINDEGKTIIMSTHHKGIIDKLGKRQIKLKKGKLEGKEESRKEETEAVEEIKVKKSKKKDD
jgi:ABC-type ATPase involved in cell division